MNRVGSSEACACGSGLHAARCHGRAPVHLRLVDFVVAGTQKGGTTALATYLGEHPEICMARPKNQRPVKELHHFDNEQRFATGNAHHAEYHGYFDPLATHRVLGDATPIYMYWESAPARMHAYNPAMKFIMLLRNPSTRAYSQWNMEKTRGRETLSFEEALRNEPERCRDAHPLQHRFRSYIDRGRYSVQLARIRALFPQAQTLVLKSETFQSDPAPALAQIAAFLGLGPFPAVEPRRVWAIPYERPMSGEAHALLQDVFAGEIAALEQVLGWDLSDWRTQQP
jgi:hypothetical protein